MEVVFGFVLEVPRPRFLSAVDLASTWGVWILASGVYLDIAAVVRVLSGTTCISVLARCRVRGAACSLAFHVYNWRFTKQK